MSEKQDKPTLLVEQDEALGFYLDSLLLTHDHEQLLEDEDENAASEASVVETSTAAETINTRTQETHHSEVSADKLQLAKDFLQASKQRQQKQQESPEKIETSNQPDNITDEPEPQKTAQKTPLATSIANQASKVITKGPVSPKPRERKITRKIEVGQSIVFSETNKEGKVTEQVLIPRSQRLAEKSLSEPTKTAAKVIPPNDLTMTSDVQSSEVQSSEVQSSDIKSSDIQNSGLENNIKPVKISESAEAQKFTEREQVVEGHEPAESLQRADSPQPEQNLPAEEAKKTTTAKEAPNLDLSLFLPKIKTLSEEEIAQQIEALTQAAVSQAQLESDLAQASQLEKRNIQALKTQKEQDTEALIRNVDNAPAWAVPDFQVLLFAVAGLKLAVPLTELNGIVEWGDEYITEMPGHAPWYLGLIQNQGKNVPVIDTLQQVVPKNRWPAEHLEQQNFKHIIMIDGGRWGLACEKVLEVITLKTDSVKWRSSRTKRRWLLGTVIEHMCALLDSSEFATMLKTGEDSLNG